MHLNLSKRKEEPLKRSSQICRAPSQAGTVVSRKIRLASLLGSLVIPALLQLPVAAVTSKDECPSPAERTSMSRPGLIWAGWESLIGHSQFSELFVRCQSHNHLAVNCLLAEQPCGSNRPMFLKHFAFAFLHRCLSAISQLQI